LKSSVLNNTQIKVLEIYLYMKIAVSHYYYFLKLIMLLSYIHYPSDIYDKYIFVYLIQSYIYN